MTILNSRCHNTFNPAEVRIQQTSFKAIVLLINLIAVDCTKITLQISFQIRYVYENDLCFSSSTKDIKLLHWRSCRHWIKWFLKRNHPCPLIRSSLILSHFNRIFCIPRILNSNIWLVCLQICFFPLKGLVCTILKNLEILDKSWQMSELLMLPFTGFTYRSPKGTHCAECHLLYSLMQL